MSVNDWHNAIMAASAEKEAALKAAHPQAWQDGHAVGEKDRARYLKNPGVYGDDTDPPSGLTDRELTTWYLGWEKGRDY